MKLGDILGVLRDAYCRTVGIEYTHLSSIEEKRWIQEQVEGASTKLSADEQRHILDRMNAAEAIEKFLATKWMGQKRFGLEGAESLIPGLKAMVDRSTELGAKSIVFGMPHRGRLNVLVNVIRKPMEKLLREFQGTHVAVHKDKAASADDWSGSGDVKYHLGTSYDRTYPDGRKVHLALVAVRGRKVPRTPRAPRASIPPPPPPRRPPLPSQNPSHLEAVNSVVVGKVRAKQDLDGDVTRSAVMGVLMHGDAAFAGQGIVYETFLLAKLAGYGTGGTVHVIVNNQVGFTTDPESARSTLHCSDLGKAFDVPIFHVNGDDPEAVVRVFELAAEYRAAFKSDVIVDLVCYRRHGHNELDQPAYTQPVMYAAIAGHASTLDRYQAALAGAAELVPPRQT